MSDLEVSGPMNGKTAEFIRYALAMVVAGLVSYFTAIGTLQSRVSVMETKVQQIQDSDIKQIREDIRDIKSDVRLLLVQPPRSAP